MENEDSNWWIWIAIYRGIDSNPIFLYGSVVPIYDDVKAFPIETVTVSKDEYMVRPEKSRHFLW